MSRHNPGKPGLDWPGFQAKLFERLNSIKTSGEIASHKEYALFVNPGLEIIGQHSISLPLRPKDADIIRDACRQAPFGRGNETIVDTSVRKTWELDHTKFRLCNPAWEGFLTDTLLKAVTEDLGLDAARVEPYKLLLYEPGSFFKPHRDSEKTPGMVATLVICLPSGHQGGEVQLTFNDGHQTIATGGPNSKYNLAALAWYSDVTHEVKELTSGHRLGLTYNIIVDNPGVNSLSHFGAQSDQLGQMLREWTLNFKHEKMLCYSLSHKYSESSLSLSILKGRDACVLTVLKSLADAAGFRLFVGHMSISEEEPIEAYAEGKVAMSLSNIFTPDGGKILTHGSISTENLLGENEYANQKPDSIQAGGYMGNEGVSAVIQYEITVIIMTPKNHAMSIFGEHEVVARMNLALLDLNKSPDHAPSIEAVVNVMTDAVSGKYGSLTDNTLVMVIDWAVRLGKDDVAQLAADLNPRSVGIIEAMAKSLLWKTQHLGAWTEDEKDAFTDWDPWFGPTMRSSQSPSTLAQCARYFSEALEDPHLIKSFKLWIETATYRILDTKSQWTEQELESIQAVTRAMHEDADWMATWLFPRLVERGTNKLLTALVLWAMDMKDFDTKHLIPHVLDKAAHRLALLDSSTTRVAVQEGFIKLVEKSLPSGHFSSFVPVIEHSVQLLSASSWRPDRKVVRALLVRLDKSFQRHHEARIPAVASLYKLMLTNMIGRPPSCSVDNGRGWAMPPKGCGHCKHCRSLSDFLQSPTATVWRLKQSAPDRRHVQNWLGPGPLWTWETERTTPDMTLVITKKMTTYMHYLERYQRVVKTLELLLEPFNTPWVKELLGEDDFRRLVTHPTDTTPSTTPGQMDGPHTAAQQPTSGPRNGNSDSKPATIGQKRPSGDTQEQYDGSEKRLAMMNDQA